MGFDCVKLDFIRIGFNLGDRFDRVDRERFTGSKIEGRRYERNKHYGKPYR